MVVIVEIFHSAEWLLNLAFIGIVLYTVSMCINAQSVSSQIKMKEGVCVILRHYTILSDVQFKNDLWAKQGGVRWPKLCVYACGYSNTSIWWSYLQKLDQ